MASLTTVALSSTCSSPAVGMWNGNWLSQFLLFSKLIQGLFCWPLLADANKTYGKVTDWSLGSSPDLSVYESRLFLTAKIMYINCVHLAILLTEHLTFTRVSLSSFCTSLMNQDRKPRIRSHCIYFIGTELPSTIEWAKFNWLLHTYTICSKQKAQELPHPNKFGPVIWRLCCYFLGLLPFVPALYQLMDSPLGPRPAKVQYFDS